MLENYNNVRYFSVSPPNLDNVPRPENILFETNCVLDHSEKNTCTCNTDCTDTVSNIETGVEINTNIGLNSVTEGITDSTDISLDSEKGQFLTRRDFVQDETRNITGSTKMLDSYDLDVKLQVKPKYYQKWARNRRSRSSTDALSVLPFSMLVRQQESAKIRDGKQDTLKRRRSTLKRRVNFERQLSSDNESKDRLFKKDRKVASRKSLQLDFTRHDSSKNLLDFPGGIVLESVDKDTNSAIKNNCKSGQNISPASAREKLLPAAPNKDQPLCSVIQLKTEMIPLIQSQLITPKSSKQSNEVNNRLTSIESNVEEISSPRKDTLFVKNNTSNVKSTSDNDAAHVEILNRNLRDDNKMMINGSRYLQDAETQERYGFHYPARSNLNNLSKRREKQFFAGISESVTHRNTETSTGVTLNIQGKKSDCQTSRVSVQLSKSSPRYTGPNNLFVDFETLRINAHLQKLGQYRNPLVSSTKRRCSSVTSPVQVIDRHGFKTVVLGYSVE